MTPTATKLPEIGDVSYPVLDAAVIGMDCYGAEKVWDDWSRAYYLVLSFHEGMDDDADWHVVAVIPESQARHIIKFGLVEMLL